MRIELVLSMQKTRYHRLLCGVFLEFNSRISPKRLHLGDMAVFASLNGHGHLLSIVNIPTVLDRAKVDIVLLYYLTCSVKYHESSRHVSHECLDNE